MRTLMAAALVVAALVAAGCADSDGGEIDPGAAGPSPDTDDETDAEDLRTVSGTLGGDARLEGGCVWLEGDDGQRYEVLWPSGWTAATDPVEVRDADGTVVAGEGEALTVRGAAATDVATTCQVGVPFRAEDVQAD